MQPIAQLCSNCIYLSKVENKPLSHLFSEQAIANTSLGKNYLRLDIKSALMHATKQKWIM